jgi:AcrR family transcriptional regulator
MSVSGQEQAAAGVAERGPRARMNRHMLATAIRLMQDGIIPSVSDVAEAAQVSRATAYRYFPSQAAMIQAVVNEALGPILGWSSGSEDARERVTELLEFSFPRMLAYEATHRAALSQALDQWTRRQAGTLGTEAPIVRGHRRGLLRQALAPLATSLSAIEIDRAAQSLSLVFGIEAVIVLKDIWRLDDRQAQRVALWAAKALVRAAIAEAASPEAARTAPSESRKAAKRPRVKGA